MKQVMGFVLRTTLILSFLFCIAVTLFPEIVMAIFTKDSNLIQLGGVYLKTVGASYILSGVSQVYLCIMKNSNHATKSMIITGITVVANIALNWIFIYGFHQISAMGIKGASLATFLANLIGFTLVIWDSLKKEGIRPNIKYSSLSISSLEKSFWGYVSPVMANEMIWGCGFTTYSVIMGHLGTDAIAANSIANITNNLLICFCMGLGSAGSIIIGNQLGAGKLEEAKKQGSQLCRLSILSGAITGILILLLIPLLLQVTNISVQAKEYLKWMLVICSYYVVGKSINSMTIGGIFCAGGDSKFGMKCDAITLWLITVPLGILAAFVLKLPIMFVYFLLNLDEIIKLPAVYKHYKKYKWIKNITQN